VEGVTMALKLPVLGEAGIAAGHVAHVGPALILVLVQLMAPEMLCGEEGGAAIRPIARVGFGACVRQLVTLQVMAPREAFVASVEPTDERSLLSAEGVNAGEE